MTWYLGLSQLNEAKEFELFFSHYCFHICLYASDFQILALSQSPGGLVKTLVAEPQPQSAKTGISKFPGDAPADGPGTTV